MFNLFMFQIFAAVATYLVILIQFQSSSRSPCTPGGLNTTTDLSLIKNTTDL